MKKILALLCAAAMTLSLFAMPVLAEEEDEKEMLEVTEDISVSADYDWTRLADKGITINVYNWGEYISDGSDDSVDVVAVFEELTGISVHYTTFDSNESMYAKLKSGAAKYDVIVPSDYMISKMIKEEMLQPLNFDNVPNYSTIDEEYRNPEYDPENAYTVPYMRCYTGIIYNTTMVENAPTCWADLWKEEYAGNIIMFNNSRDAYAIAALKLGMSINPASAEEVDMVVNELKTQKPLVQGYYMDEIFDKMEGAEAAIGVYYSGDGITMIDENPDLAWVYPEEGFNVSVDALCIPATVVDPLQKEAAEMFINFMLEIDVAVANTEYVGYSAASTEVWENLSEELKYSEIAYPDESLTEKSYCFTALDEEINDALDTAWSEMKSYEENGNGYLVLVFLAASLGISLFNIVRKTRRKKGTEG